MRTIEFKSSDFQLRESNAGQEFVALDWRVATNTELINELKEMGVTRVIPKEKIEN